MSTGPFFATPTQAPIQLPEHVLATIVLLLPEVIPAVPETGTLHVRAADARSLYAGVVGGIGSVCKAWRLLVKRVLMGDELAWLRVSCAAEAAECLSSFPHARSLRIVGDASAGDIVAVLGSRSVTRLAIANNRMTRGFGCLGQLVGLRALYLEGCEKLRDVTALSSLGGLHTLHLSGCVHWNALLDGGGAASSAIRKADRLAASLATSLLGLTQLTSLNLEGTHASAVRMHWRYMSTVRYMQHFAAISPALQVRPACA
jgi:hypothetical protein